MRQNFVEFEPSHTAVLVTNHLPKVSGDDPALWARLTVIPFDVVIPEVEVDPNLLENLKRERDAVLTWTVDGLIEYEKSGMSPPPEVLQATDSYKADSDSISRFLDDTCQVELAGRVSKPFFYHRWLRWSKQENVQSLGKKSFNQAIADRGFSVIKTHGSEYWRGLTLLDDLG